MRSTPIADIISPPHQQSAAYTPALRGRPQSYFEKMTRERRPIAVDAHRANHCGQASGFRRSMSFATFIVNARGKCPIFSVARLSDHAARSHPLFRGCDGALVASRFFGAR